MSTIFFNAGQSGEVTPAEAGTPYLQTRLVNPLIGSEWDRFVTTHPEHTFFHSAAWAKVLAASYGHEPFYLSCSRWGKLLALIPIMEVRSCLTGRRGVCLPFADSCGPLVFDGCDPALVTDQLSSLAWKRQWKYFEVRGGPAPEVAATPSVSFHGHTLDLRPGKEALLKGFASSVRRAIRKAERSDLSVEVLHTPEALLDYYRLHLLTRKRHGLPAQPLSFFLNIYQEIIEPGFGFVVLAKQSGRTLSGAVFFRFGKKAVYKFGASDETLQEFRGNNLVIWEGIKFLAQDSVESLHLGRTSLGNTGLRRFKQSWSTQEEVIEYYRCERASGHWITEEDQSSGLHTAAFRRMPSGINRLVGSLLYPHLD